MPLKHRHWVVLCLIHATFQHSSPQASRVIAVSCGACFTAVPRFDENSRRDSGARPKLVSAGSRYHPVPVRPAQRCVRHGLVNPPTRCTSDFRRLAVGIRLQWSIFRGHVSVADSVFRQIHREKTPKFASARTSCDIVPLHPAQSRSQAGLVRTLTTCQSDCNGLASISIDWRRLSTMKVSMTAEPGGRLSPAKIAVRPPAGWTGCHRFSVVSL